MLKKTIKYTDFNGEEVSEDFFFHLSKAELIELEMSQQGGLSEWLKRVVAAEDGASIIAEFKKIILSAYGQKSVDGRRFVKNQQLRDEFESSEAYSALFVELVTNADAAAEFVNGVIPTDMAAEAAKVVALDIVPPVVETVELLGTRENPRVITRAELIELPADQMEIVRSGMAEGKVILGD